MGTFLSWVLIKVTGISRMSRDYDRMKHLSGSAFMDAILETYQIDYDIPTDELKRLPKEGPYITISNHPLGGIDGVVLLKLMLQHRPDYKIMANFLLQRIASLALPAAA